MEAPFRTVDPITVEVIQNRMMEIARQSGIILTLTAASPVTVEAKDLGLNIADHLGRAIVYSVWMPRHGTTLGYMLRSCEEQFKDDLRPNDIYMTNNPYKGALHLSDIALIAPIYLRDELIAWVGCATHHTDIGGMTPGWSPTATDWYGEGIKFPPVKLVRGGEMNKDIFNIFLTNVRTPDFQAHDLMAQIAAISYAKDKVVQIADRYGVDVLKSTYEEIIKFGEEKARARIRAIPDGVYEYMEYMDYDDIHAIRCVLTVDDDTLSMDFVGTDEQAQASINAALPCSIANIHNIYTCMLLPDVFVNEGCFRPLKINIPPGTVLSCLPPAACSGSSIQAGWKAQCAAIGVFSRALNYSDEWWRANAGWGSGHPVVQISGTNQWGQKYTFHVMDGSLEGGGARAAKDGVDACNIAGSTNTSVPNVETHEQRYPMLYLYRKYSMGSGGPGKYRGGAGGEYAFKPHGVERLDALCFYIGEVIPANPINGGFPGATVHMYLKRKTNVNELLLSKIPSFDELSGDFIELVHKNAIQPMGPTDVLYSQCPGGGGNGDPLERPPEIVAADVRKGLVSLKQLREAYGVVLDDSNVNWIKSEEVRGEIRKHRIANRPSSTGPSGSQIYGSKIPKVPEYLGSTADNGITLTKCANCDFVLARGSSSWPSGVKIIEVPCGYFGVNIKEDPRVKFFLLLCPKCGKIFETQIEAIKRTWFSK